ncbi:hypothetical protein ABZ353_28000 [Streptomyces niveus]|uniref:hypothetical protein n=1 Tax=Streptomyces niveus TaxID=193462 RepID=UPI0033FC8E2C
MPVQESNTLKSQYAQKVTADLEQNTAEQERVRVEISSLQEKLSGLEQDHELLVGMRAALGDTGTVPAPRRTGKKASAKAPSAKKAAGRKAPVGTGEKTPVLSDLVHQHLSAQSEPVTAGEIAKALTAAHPQRNISDNLVRTATERLVARSRVERAKQGSTVYYTVSKQDDSASTTASAVKEAAAVGT